MKTNSTAVIQWKVNEPATTLCSLSNRNSIIETISCNNTWKKEDLKEGQYTLKIVATDIEGNSATKTHLWDVGK
jgi:hypothetical protein